MEEDKTSVVNPVVSAEASTNVTTIPPSSDDNANNQISHILKIIKRDIIAADIKWSLFVAASQSYKHDSCLRPFPPMFLRDRNKDFSALSEAVEAVPPFSQLESQLDALTKMAVKLLHWVLVDLKEPSLTVVDKSEVTMVLDQVPCELAAPPPTLVLNLHYDPSSPSELRWMETKQQYSSLYAFHGSSVENFHSILHCGLQQHLTKNALFGQGVYLSSELVVCLPYSRNGFGWNHSVVANELSVVALCEVLDHPSVHRQTQGDYGRAKAADSIAGEVPHKFYVVPNSDLVRVRHILIYTSCPLSQRQLRLNQQCGSILTWMSRHKMTISLVAYAMVLMSIGMSRSPTIMCYWRDIWTTSG